MHLYHRFVIIIFVSLLPAGLTFAQQPDLIFDHLTIENGLSHNNARDVFIDSKGFVWISTYEGLNRYDGYTCKVYRHIPGDPKSISSNFARNVTEDSQGNIWIATNYGVNRYSYLTDDFSTISLVDENPDFYKRYGLQWVMVDNNDRIWFTTEVGVIMYDPKTSKTLHLQHDPGNPNSLPGNFCPSIMQDNRGRFWISTLEGLVVFDEEKGSFTRHLYNPDDPASISSNRIMTVLQDSKNRIWVGTQDNGLNYYDEPTKQFVRFISDPKIPGSLSYPMVNHIAEDKLGNLWISTSGGLNRYDPLRGSFMVYRHQTGNERSLTTNDIMATGFDQSNIMYVTTLFGGVNIYDEGKRKFRHYKNSFIDPKSLSGNNVTSFAEDKNGNIWVGVDGGGLNYLNRFTNQFDRFNAIPGNPNSIADDKVLALLLDSRNQLWIGTWGAGLSVMDLQTNTFRHYRHDPADITSLSDNNIFYIIEDSQGFIWVATWGNGINRYDQDNGIFKQYVNSKNDPTSIPPSLTLTMMEDRLGNIWTSHDGGGVCFLDQRTDKFTCFSTSNEVGSVTSNSIESLLEDSKGRLWVGANGGGLNLFDRETQTFSAYRIEDGLPNESINGILEDDDGNLWLSTNYGLCRFNPDSLTFKNYNVSDGLQSNQFGRWAYKKLSTGELLFGGVNGFNLFDPSTVKDNPLVPPVFITSFKLFNIEVPVDPKSILKKNIMFTDRIVLKYKQNVISFEFTALNFRQAEKNQYMYKLEGFNRDWMNLAEERRVSFTNLSPGRYTLRIKASNNDLIWNEEGASLEIVVKPPVWRTWWFLSLLIVLIIAGIRYFIKQRELTLRKDKETLESSLKQGEEELALRKKEIEEQRQILFDKEKAEAASKWTNIGLNQFTSLINRHKQDVSIMTSKLISELVNYLEMSVGGIFIYNPEPENGEEPYLELISYYAPTEKTFEKRQIMPGEGNVGTAFNEKRIIEIDSLPEGYASMNSGLGKTDMKFLVLVPIMFDVDIIGVFELLSIDKPEPYKLEFVARLGEVLAATLMTVHSGAKTTKMLEEVIRTNEIMAAQDEELRQNLEEVTATQEELERQRERLNKLTEEYKEREEALTTEIKLLKAKFKKDQ